MVGLLLAGSGNHVTGHYAVGRGGGRRSVSCADAHDVYTIEHLLLDSGRKCTQASGNRRGRLLVCGLARKLAGR